MVSYVMSIYPGPTSLDTIKMDGLFLLVVLGALDDGESIEGEKMTGIDTLPNDMGGWRVILRTHNYTRSLRTLVYQDVDHGRLGNVNKARHDLLAAAVGRLDAAAVASCQGA
jgi:hypothetical protein